MAVTSASKLYGFQASVRSAGKDNYKSTQAGTFSFTGTALVVLCEDGSTRGNSGCKAATPLEFIEHTNATSKNSYTFDWTPPATDVGDIKIYVAGNAGNGDGKADNKDLISTNAYTLKLASGGPPAKPAISANGVVSAAAFGGAQAMGPGSWIEIYGSNLATSTKEWGGGDFTGTTAPTTLDGVKVTVANVPAFIRYISPGQINVQIPSGLAAGAVTVEVIRDGQSSGPALGELRAAAPALFSYRAAGGLYVAAVFLDGTLVGTRAVRHPV